MLLTVNLSQSEEVKFKFLTHKILLIKFIGNSLWQNTSLIDYPILVPYSPLLIVGGGKSPNFQFLHTLQFIGTFNLPAKLLSPPQFEKKGERKTLKICPS